MSDRPSGEADDVEVDDATRLSHRTWADAGEHDGDDVTRLASRGNRDQDEDATQISSRAQDEHDEDSTRISSRSPGPQTEDDDSTQLSARSAAEHDDATQISGRDAGRAQPHGTAPSGTRSRRPGETSDESTQASPAARGGRGRRLPTLPPGAVVGGETHAGSFGTVEPAHGPREVPVTSQASVSPVKPSVPGPAGRPVLSPDQAVRRRDSARRRRLAIIVVVACLTAASLTGAVLGAVALL